MTKIFLWLIRDLHLKIIAILVTFAFWIYVSLDRSYELSLETQVKINNLKNNLIVSSALPEVGVTFSGKGRELLKLKIRHPWIALNLAQAHIGENILPVSAQNIITQSADVAIVKTSHKEIVFFVNEKAEKYVEPTIITQGEPKEGFALKDILWGEKVKATGPKERLQHLKEIVSEPLILNNQGISFSRFLALIPPTGGNISISPCSLYVQVIIEEKLERFFLNVPVHLIFPPGASAMVEPIAIESLVISGPKSLVSTASLEDFSITIDLRGKIRGRYSLPAEIRLPKNLRLVVSKPKFFNVTLR